MNKLQATLDPPLAPALSAGLSPRTSPAQSPASSPSAASPSTASPCAMVSDPSPPHSPFPGGAPVDTDLIEGLAAEEVHRRALAARKSLGKSQRAISFWLVEMERRRLFKHFNCGNVFHYAEVYLELAPHTIAEFLRTGKELERLPLLAHAFACGGISSSKIREISRVATPQTELQWLEVASRSTCRQVEKLVALTPRGGLPGECCREQSSSRKASPHSSSPALCAAEVTAGSEATTRAEAMADGACSSPSSSIDRSTGIESSDSTQSDPPGILNSPRGGSPDSIRAKASTPVSGESRTSDGTGPFRSKLIIDVENDQMALISAAFDKARKETGCRDKSELVSHIMRAYLAGASSDDCHDSPPCRVTLHHLPEMNLTWVEGMNGQAPVGRHVLDEALCDAEILDLGRQREDNPESAHDADRDPTWDPKPAEVSLSSTCTKEGRSPSKGSSAERDALRHGPRLRKTLPPTLKRQVLARDQHCCSVPGCNNRAFVHIHHIIPLTAGGKDRAHSLTTVCAFHHRAVHRGLLQVSGRAPDALVWKNPKAGILKGSQGAEREAR